MSERTHGSFLLKMLAADADKLDSVAVKANLKELELALAPEMPENVRTAALRRLRDIGDIEAFKVLARIAEMKDLNRDDADIIKSARLAIAAIGPAVVNWANGHDLLESLIHCLKDSYADEPLARKLAKAIATCYRQWPECVKQSLAEEMDLTYAQNEGIPNPPLGIEVDLGRFPFIAERLGADGGGVELMSAVARRIIETFDSDQCGSLLDASVKTLRDFAAWDVLLELCAMAENKKVYRRRVLRIAVPGLMAEGGKNHRKRTLALITSMLEPGKPDQVRTDAMEVVRFLGQPGYDMLTGALTKDGSRLVREAAAAALKKLALGDSED